jgi:hypothetical protein
MHREMWRDQELLHKMPIQSISARIRYLGNKLQVA